MAAKMADKTYKITVCFEARPDGGLRAYSDDVPGLVLSSMDIDGVLADVIEALSFILSQKMHQEVQVRPLEDVRAMLENNGVVGPRAVPGSKEYVAIPLH